MRFVIGRIGRASRRDRRINVGTGVPPVFPRVAKIRGADRSPWRACAST